MEPKKYEYIDSLRGIAILYVIVVHIATVLGFIKFPYFSQYPVFEKFALNGMYGVSLFFIVSAFTLMMSHYNRINEPNATRNFVIRRFFRIAPMYYLAIIGITFLKYIRFSEPGFGLSSIPVGNLLSEIFFVNALFPDYINRYVPGGWSISVEFMFYIFVPLICRKIKDINAALILMMVSVFISAIFSKVIEPMNLDLNFILFNPAVQLPMFTFGIFLYLLLNKPLPEPKKIVLILLAIFIFVFCYVPIPYNFLIGLGFSVIVIIQNKHSLKLLSNKLLVAVGKVSYSMYLIHFFVIYMLLHFDITHITEINSYGSFIFNFVAMYLLVAVITFLLANIVYRIIEIPGQNLGKRLIKNLNRQTVK